MKCLILFLTFLSVTVFECHSKYTGCKEVDEVEICVPAIYNFIKNTLIPEIKNQNIDSLVYDLYIYLSPYYYEEHPEKCSINISIESTRHIPYVIGARTYMMIDGYTFFCDGAFFKAYAKRTGQRKSFEFDYRETREDKKDNYSWSYSLVGNYRQPSGFVVIWKKSGLPSSEKVDGMFERLHEERRGPTPR